MRRFWSSILADLDGRRKLVLLVSIALVAVLIGFVVVPADLGGKLIIHAGYYYILGIFSLWVYFAWRVAAAIRSDWRDALKRNWKVLGFLAAATAFAVWTDTFGHKLLFDDYVLQGTSWHLHTTKEVSTPVRAYEFQGTWLDINTFLDKRPYFFAFLVSIIHDLTGFRLENVFVLNVGCALVVLASAYWCVKTLSRRRGPALLAVCLLAGLPLFGQNATGASMELLNLAMIGVIMVSATLYLRKPDQDRLSLLVLGAVLLAQARYESVLYVIPAAGVIVTGWIKQGRVILSWPSVFAPLMLVPYAWHDRFVSTNQFLWQLREGEHSRFALEYLSGNVRAAWAFFTSRGADQPNSIWLVLLGAAGFVWAVVHLWLQRTRRTENLSPAATVVAWFALTAAVNLAMLMFYYWSRLDEAVAARFALPAFLMLSISGGWFVQSIDSRGWPAMRLAVFGTVIYATVVAAPIFAKRLYTERITLRHELEWEREQFLRRPGPILVVTAKAALPYLLEKIPALNTSIARQRGPQIAWHMKEGTFREVLVSQLIRPTSGEGDPAVDPEDELPDSFQLETLATKSFNGRWVRISRITKIQLP